MMDSTVLRRNGVRTPSHNPAKNAGFTLIELMITVVIIGIMGSIAFTSFQTLNKQMDFDGQYQQVKNSVQKCRSEALLRSNPVTSPTTIVFFTNGYACISWNDFNTGGPSRLGSGSAVDMGSNGVLDVGEANSEVSAVYFQSRFDTSLALNAIPTQIYIDTASSTLQAGTFQDTGSGYAFMYAPGGYMVASNRTKVTATLIMKSLNGPPSRFVMYSSGQMVGQ